MNSENYFARMCGIDEGGVFKHWGYTHLDLFFEISKEEGPPSTHEARARSQIIADTRSRDDFTIG